MTLAQIYEKGKRWDGHGQGARRRREALQADDEKETVYFMRGAMYERMKKYDAAEAEFRKVMELNPENAGALNYLGYMLADRDVRLEEAARLDQEGPGPGPGQRRLPGQPGLGLLPAGQARPTPRTC